MARKMIVPFSLDGDDVFAVLAALPLVAIIGADSPAQQRTNLKLCASVSEKLSHAARTLKPNELRVVAAAVAAACLYLSGQLPLALDPELSGALSAYRELYPALNARLSKVLPLFGT